MASSSRPSSTIDLIGEDLLQNIVSRLPAASFAFAACVNRSWHLVCDRLLLRPKLSSACSFHFSLNVAAEDVVSKVLSGPIRPHFAIASVGPYFDFRLAHQLVTFDVRLVNDKVSLAYIGDRIKACYIEKITAKLGSKVPVITNHPSGVIGRNAFSDEFKEIQWEVTEEDDDPGENLSVSESENRAFMLTVGFVPGLKVEAIPLVKQAEEPHVVMVDKFVMDIREFSTSISGCESPAAIIVFNQLDVGVKSVMEKLDYAMSPDTVIVGDSGCEFIHRSENSKNTTISDEQIFLAVALVFAVDRNRSPGTGQTQFHAIISSGLLPIGPTYKAASVREKPHDSLTWLTARRDGSRENLDGETILSQVYDELGDRIQFPTFYIGVTKRRKCSVGQEKLGWITSLAFHEVLGDNQEYLFVGDIGIKTGDTFRFYHSDSTTALSSISNVSDQLRSFKESSITDGNKREVFGSFIFTCCGRGESFFGQPNVDSSPFLENFSGVTFGGTFCGGEIGRGDLTPYVTESQEHKSIRCCLHVYSAVYLVMSYTPP